VSRRTDKWEQESKALDKIQAHFDLTEKTDAALRHRAIDEVITPSNLIRKIVGLEYSVINRSRVSVQFNDSDQQLLSARYNVDPDNTTEIKRRLKEEVQLYFRKEDE